MTTYVQKKSRAFREAGEPEPIIPKRSEARMKRYPSATDARAWTLEREDRRQHILELLLSKTAGLNLGRFIPLEVLINTLLANKDADIEELRQQIEELQKLLGVYEKLDLTPEQKQQLEKMKEEIGMAGESLSTISGRHSRSGGGPSSVSGTSGRRSDIGESTTTGDKSLASTPRDQTTSGKSSSKGKHKAGDGATTDEDECAASDYGETRPSCKSLTMADLEGLSPEELKKLLLKKQAEIESLKNALSALQEECDQHKAVTQSAVEQLENLSDIVQERDRLKQSMQEPLDSATTADRLKQNMQEPFDSAATTDRLKQNMQEPFDSAGVLAVDPNNEAAAIEDQIEELRRKGLLTPEKEIELLKKELQTLKDCCAKLPIVMADNKAMKEQLGLGDTEETFEDIKKQAEEARDIEKKNQELEKQLAELGKQLDDKHKELADKHQELADKHQQLADKDKQLNSAKDTFNGEKAAAQSEVASVKKQMSCKCREVDALRLERDCLRKKLAEAEAQEQEIEKLRYRVKETEVLRIERDRMKMRLDELSNIEMEFMDLLEKTKGYDALKGERDMFKTKYEELLGLECEVDMLRSQLDASQNVVDEKNALQRQVLDLTCCMADQENEINRLVDHIENLAQGRDQQQSLAFEDLQYMHSKVCDATANLLNNQEGGPTVEPSETDKYLLMKRNMSLEKTLAGKQQECQNTVTKLEMDINAERHRLEDLRKHLEMEKYTNVELLKRLKMQTKAVANIQAEREMMKRKSNLHEEKLQRYINAIEQEKARVKDLEVELNNERNNVKRLKDILNMERDATMMMRNKDSEQMEMLRMELEKALNSEMMLRMQLEQNYPPSYEQPHQHCPGTCPATRKPNVLQVHPNSTSFYTELKVGERNKQQRLMRRDVRQEPNREFED